MTAGGVAWDKLSTYLIKRRELAGQQRSKETEAQRQTKADALTQLTAVLEEVRADLERHKEESSRRQEEMQREINDHKVDAQNGWAEVRRLQSKLLKVQAANRKLRFRVNRNSLRLNMVQEEAHEAHQAAVAVKKRTTDVHLPHEPPPDSKETQVGE